MLVSFWSSSFERGVAYGHVSTAMMALRSLSSLQQTLVLRMLFSSLEEESGEAKRALEELRVLGLAEMQGDELVLQQDFANSLRRGLAAPSSATGLKMAEVLAKKAQADAELRW
jgi:hypothetical protein